ncbi:3-carboxy-cis,cis-muconate cycloisomerase [Pusillimonas sp. NJUB218]|uniref:3-carboxy-cis,cis-muconate cycloisomerase n=1 Tax=Pusillimonas sp. NJUB218 TaxID=2023230 RepID=UPI000F4C7F37|nr:3-carboxy-cis,cis-muconate cycloisomerase [Pusillimonas sp. NJUB218]ROT44216.1 3-carboxy-cis,cis-muconate cycloisomerase [Pusillimonas sp. NJUB218]
MSVPIFDSFLTTTDIIDVFDDMAVIQGMLDFEAALARAQAAEGLIPAQTARIIEKHCVADAFDLPAIIVAARRAGSMAIPLVKALTQKVATEDPEAATKVHWGSTSQDVIDTAAVLVTRKALALIDGELNSLAARLLTLAQTHIQTPVLARTLMQPAQVTSLGFKFANWAAPLVRSRTQLKTLANQALQLQLGGAVGTLAVMGEKGPAVAQRVAADLGLANPLGNWHTQRDEWVRLGLEVAVLTGSLGKIATDLSLMAQGEIAELAEPSGQGRGGSSAMPHKRNPVSSMIALAAAGRTPHRAAALLANMPQEHERGLGNWQAELAEWPGLFLSAHGALTALREAMDGLVIDAARMRQNIDALQGLIFAEAVSIYLAGVIGRPAAHHLMETLTARAVTEKAHLSDVVRAAVNADEALRTQLDLSALDALFDPVNATHSGAAMARTIIPQLLAQLA